MPGGLVDKKDQGDVRTRRAEIMTAEYSEHFRTVVADVFLSPATPRPKAPTSITRHCRASVPKSSAPTSAAVTCRKAAR